MVLVSGKKISFRLMATPYDFANFLQWYVLVGKGGQAPFDARNALDLDSIVFNYKFDDSALNFIPNNLGDGDLTFLGDGGSNAHYILLALI